MVACSMGEFTMTHFVVDESCVILPLHGAVAAPSSMSHDMFEVAACRAQCVACGVKPS